MGVQGLWDLVSPAGQKRSFKELTVNEGFVRNRHGLRTIIVGIDTAIWLSQVQKAFLAGHAQAGENPELRAIFFKLAHLLHSPVTPLFVFDGPGRPNKKRGVNVVKKPTWLTTPLQEMLDAFQFQFYTAPGEAEAELARLNQARIIDAIMTEDSDVLVFGATRVIRDWTAGNDIVTVYTSDSIKEHEEVALTRGGMLLVAMLSGSDYNPSGLKGFGPKISQRLAHAGFGDGLLSAAVNLPLEELEIFLSVWRQDLHAELQQNKGRRLSQRCRSLADLIPDDFPDLEHLRFHALPMTSFTEGTAGPDLSLLHPRPPDIARLASICNRRFGWGSSGELLRRFEKSLWGGLCVQMVCYKGLGTQFHHQPEYPLERSAIKRIRMTKSGSGLTSGLVEYLVDFSPAALVSIAQTALVGAKEEKPPERLNYVCSTWIPAPVLSRYIPQMVAEHQARRKLHASSRVRTFERVFTTPPPKRALPSPASGHRSISSSSSCDVLEMSSNILDPSNEMMVIDLDYDSGNESHDTLSSGDLTESDDDPESRDIVIDLTSSDDELMEGA